MARSKLTWKYYSSRRKGLTIEKYITTHSIKSLEELRENLRQKGVQLPDPELLKDLFKPAWTGKYPPKTEVEQTKETKSKTGSTNAKTRKPKPSSRKKKPKKQVADEKKSTYLQAAYETGSQDDDPNAEPGA